MASSSSSVFDSLAPNHPVNFAFPKCSFGSKGEKRAFNTSWFQIQFCVVSVLRQMKKTYFLMGCIAEEI